jgi:NAD(P)-dependent dehydrogenase (short-subunit alcohol dehydrogenase family)
VKATPSGTRAGFAQDGLVTSNEPATPRRHGTIRPNRKAMAEQQNESKKEMEHDFFEHARLSSLLKRFATADEVAAMVTYAAGELSSATNGAALRVDGGVVKAIL